MLRRWTACALVLALLSLAGAAPARAEERAVTFRCVGDFVLHMPVIDAARTADGGVDFHDMLAPVADLLGDADYTVANVDGVMGASDVYSGYPRFNAPESLLDTIRAAGVDFLTLANNHMLDRYFEERSVPYARSSDDIIVFGKTEEELNGYVNHIQAEQVGLVSLHLGGGRATKDSVIDPAVGLVLKKKVGDAVCAGEPLAVIHAATETAAKQAAAELSACFSITDKAPEKPPFILDTLR